MLQNLLQMAIGYATLTASYIPNDYQSWAAGGLIVALIAVLTLMSIRLYDGAFHAAFTGGSGAGFVISALLPVLIAMANGAVIAVGSMLYGTLIGVILAIGATLTLFIALLAIGLVLALIDWIRLQRDLKRIRKSFG